jgi:hypothetical protein
MHMIWLSIVIPSMLFVVWAFPVTRHRSVWSLCLGIAVLGLVGLIGFDLFVFFQQGGQWQHGFMKSVFSLLMNTDVPLVPLALGSFINWWISGPSVVSSPKDDQTVPPKLSDVPDREPC